MNKKQKFNYFLISIFFLSLLVFEYCNDCTPHSSIIDIIYLAASTYLSIYSVCSLINYAIKGIDKEKFPIHSIIFALASFIIGTYAIIQGDHYYYVDSDEDHVFLLESK